MWKKCVCLFMAVLLLSHFVFAQDIAFKHIDWEKLDVNLTQLEMNLNLLKTDNQRLQNLLTEQETYSANQSIRYQNLEIKYQKLEKYTKKWRTTSLALIVIVVAETAMLILR